MSSNKQGALVTVVSCTALTCVVGIIAAAFGLFDWPIWQSAVIFAVAGLIGGCIAVARRRTRSESR
ncbi:hypothetical protein [Streptomyces sp. NPDC016845]|uniref:hypothetical protein n=1 Tax=Streptomyces sp. NPDC016845 TaxID=3364972 RepID=UPI0037928694